MKKRLLTLAMIVCLVLSMSACGGSNSSESSSEGTITEETTEETASSGEESESNSDLPTLEGFFNSEVMQAVIDATKEQYEEQGVSAEMYAEGDELHYVFTVNDLETTEEDRAVLAESLKASLEANAASFQDTAKQAQAAVSNEKVSVVVTYKDGAGNELYSQSFSSDDAASADTAETADNAETAEAADTAETEEAAE